MKKNLLVLILSLFVWNANAEFNLNLKRIAKPFDAFARKNILNPANNVDAENIHPVMLATELLDSTYSWSYSGGWNQNIKYVYTYDSNNNVSEVLSTAGADMEKLAETFKRLYNETSRATDPQNYMPEEKTAASAA